MLLVARDEGKRVNVAVQIGQCETRSSRPCARRTAAAAAGLPAPDRSSAKRAKSDTITYRGTSSWRPSLSRSWIYWNAWDSALSEILAAALVLDQQHPLPEQIDSSVGSGNLLDRFLERSHGAAAHAEDLEEFVPKRLFFGDLALGTGPIGGEANGVLADLVP